ncbi:hypothetical protein [Bradyrhizobium japonicum]|uniref:hypothetical protein n=1 Tax=Bradyrhizobium japonicum TaxID=375 RepID=UPI003390F1F3
MPIESNSATILAIDEFISNQENLSFLNDFDNAMRGREERLPTRHPSDAADLSWQLYELARAHFYMLRVANLKIVKIARGISWAIKAGNATVQMSLVRSLLEHTAALSFQLKVLAALQDDLSRQADSRKLRQAIERHHETVRKIYFNQSYTRGTGTAEKPDFHVNDYRKVLQRDYPEQERAYDKLCEFVHPNYGSNYLVSSGELGHGLLDRGYSEYEPDIEFANTCTRTCLELANHYETGASILLVFLDSRVEIAGKSGNRPMTIFNDKGLSHEGDGRAKGSALYFTKARTHGEAVDMMHRYLRSESREFKHSVIEGIDGGFLYERVETDVDTLWFKTRLGA